MLKKLKKNKSIVYVHSLMAAIPTFAYDLYRFIKHATLGGDPQNIHQHNSILTKEYHKLEKSLTYKEFKPYSAQYVITEIFRLIKKNAKEYGMTSVADISLNVVEQYIKVHKDRGYENEYIKKIETELKEVQNLEHTNSDKGGTKVLKKSKIIKLGKKNLEDFFYSRYSIREFSEKDVTIETIEQAIQLSLKTPSVCNRQGWNVHVLTNKDNIVKVSKLQGGSRGFGHKINKLLIVTSTLNSFHEIKERNQNWIDGGLFSMSLVYSLHSLGLASCCLNWAAKPQKDIKLRQMVPMEDQESTIMMIAVGHYPQTVTVCESPRKNASEVLHVHS